MVSIRAVKNYISCARGELPSGWGVTEKPEEVSWDAVILNQTMAARLLAELTEGSSLFEHYIHEKPDPGHNFVKYKNKIYGPMSVIRGLNLMFTHFNEK